MRFLASLRLTRSFITVAVAVATAAATATVVASLAAPALASTDTTLISNLGQTQQPEHWESVGPEDSLVHAQALKFTTGNNAGGYSLASVTAWLKDVGSNNAPQVSIYTLDEHGLPEEILYTLNNPTTFANDALNTFTVPADGVLAKETGYFVVFENSVEAPTDSVLYRIGFVDGNSVDANGAAGWGIATDEDYTVLFDRRFGDTRQRYAEAEHGPTRIRHDKNYRRHRSAEPVCHHKRPAPDGGMGRCDGRWSEEPDRLSDPVEGCLRIGQALRKRRSPPGARRTQLRV